MKRRTFLTGTLGLTALPGVYGMDSANPRVRLRTERGDLTLELFADRAPITVANFLKYLDAGWYAKGSFYRVVRPAGDANPTPINVVQGGLRQDPAPYPGIEVESTQVTGLSHVDGVVSMARQVPGWSSPLATSEFFICIGNNKSLDAGGARNSDGQGFAAFGRVVQGMDVVRSIHGLQPGNSMQGTRWAGQVLDRPVKFIDARRLTQE